MVADASTMTGSLSSTPVSVDRIAEIEAVAGVARASAGIWMTVDPDAGMSMGMPQGILGSDVREIGYEAFKLKVAEGRDLDATTGARPSWAAISPRPWGPRWARPSRSVAGSSKWSASTTRP